VIEDVNVVSWATACNLAQLKNNHEDSRRRFLSGEARETWKDVRLSLLLARS